MSDKLVYAALALSILGLMSLVFLSSFIELPYTSVADVDTSMLGKNVHLRGGVDKVHAFKGGSMMLALTDEGSSVEVYVPYSAAVKLNSTSLQGASVDLIGEVQLYEGRLEVIVTNPGDLVVE